MKFKKIQTKMLVTLIPVIAIALVIITVISAKATTGIVERQISSTMNATIEGKSESIEKTLNQVQTMALSISDMVAGSYDTMDWDHYEAVLSNMISENSMVLGSGLWFEPNTFDKAEKYYGPYVMRDGDSLTTTWDYSNADYDYFSQEYYTNAKSAEKGKAIITDPYYDATSGKIMSTCSAPIYDGDKFLGCVTVDMELSTITDVVDIITVGKAGKAMMVIPDGTYIAGTDEEKIQSAAKITEDDNASLAAAGKTIIEKKTGTATYTASKKSMNAYYGEIPETGWILILTLPTAELTAEVNYMVRIQIIVLIIALIATTLVVVLQVSRIAKNIRSVQAFSDGLASGDLTIDQLKVTSQDELGRMGNALNAMYDSNRSMIGNIAEHSEKMSESSRDLEEASAELEQKFEEIREFMNRINEATTSSSAATEEVNASAEEVNASMTSLAGETSESVKAAEEIKKRAAEVEAASRASTESARTLSTKFEAELGSSIENSKVVENIGEMADVIAGIAEQINLLSLNASIEAARAGEAGKGFAVVADEIGKLANETSTAVKNIQDTVQQVQDAFSDLSDNSKGLLSFVTDTVMPDYGKFTETASQYGKDADYFASISEKVAQMSDDVEEIMKQVSLAIQNIAESSQDTADVSSNVLSSVEEVSGTVGQVSDMSHQQQEISDDLDKVVRKFKL